MHQQSEAFALLWNLKNNLLFGDALIHAEQVSYITMPARMYGTTFYNLLNSYLLEKAKSNRYALLISYAHLQQLHCAERLVMQTSHSKTPQQ